jgi:hypothetical protein
MIDPTITGCFRNPRKNTPQGPKKRFTAALMRSMRAEIATEPSVINLPYENNTVEATSRKCDPAVQAG